MPILRNIRRLLWRILGIDYYHSLQIHDYVFLKKDSHSTIGKKTYDNGALVWRWTNEPLIIGKYCSIANNVRFIVDDGYHTISKLTNFPLVNNLYKHEDELPSGRKKNEFLNSFNQRKGIEIGNDVWIGMNSIILPGVTVGNGVTIAANSVVTKSFPDYCIIGGNPAAIIKFKFNTEEINALNKIQWWDWDERKLKKNIEDFYQNPQYFIEKHSKVSK